MPKHRKSRGGGSLESGADSTVRPIVILHLSDLQFGKNHRFAWHGAAETDPDAAGFDTLLARLQQDLRELKDGTGRALVPDLIVLTGDLAEWGVRSELEDVLRFTRSLAGTFSLNSEQCVILPGNHDINRDLCEGYFNVCKGRQVEPEPPYWPKWEAFDWLFHELHDRNSKVQFSQDRPWSLYVYDELRVVIAALNSTMRESHRAEDHYGWLGERQMRWFEAELARYQERGWLRIAALHHNLRRGPVRDDENLRDADDFVRILGGRVNLILHGHTHDGNLDWLPGPHRVPILATGSAAVIQAARPPEVPNQYQMLRIGPDRIERWTRGYASDRKRWIGDTRLDPDGNEWHSSLRVELVDVAATFPVHVPEAIAPRDGVRRSSVREDHASHLPAYAAWAHQHFEHLPMVGLGDGDLELTLDEVYVPLAFAPRERGDQGPGTGKEQVHREAFENVDLRDAFRLAGDRHLFVRGEPGTGKTTALKKLLWSLLSSDMPSGFDGSKLDLPADTVPVLIRMRDLAGPALERDFGDVLDDVLVAATRSGAHAGGKPPACVVPAGLGRWLWDRGGVLLLLDGLDEIATREARRQVCRRVEDLAKDGGVRGIRVVASSRFAGIETEGSINLDERRFLHLDVRPLDDARITQLVTRWYEAAGRARSRMRREPEDAGAARGRVEAGLLLDALKRDVSIKLKELAGTPLYLTLLCLVTERGGQMPDRRVDFFRACLDALLGQRASERAGERLLALNESLDLLGAVAWGMHKERQQYDLNEGTLRDLLAKPLSGLQNQRTRKPAVTFNAVLSWFRQVGGVLVEHAVGEYGFGHLGLQEYLAARHAATYPAEGIDTLVEHFESSWWQEVALLFVALPEYRHFGSLMKGVIDRGKLISGRAHVRKCLLEAHARDLSPFVELIADREAPVEQRVEALRLVWDQADDRLIKLASEIALEPLPEQEPAGVAQAWTELRLLAEQVETHAPLREKATPVEEPAKGVLVICHEADEARARGLERSMKGWGWEAGVATSLHAWDEPWRRARAFVVLTGPGGRGSWEKAGSRQCLVEMVRREVPLVSALSGGTEASALPAFLQERPREILGENVLESRLAAVLAVMLDVTVPELSVSLIEAGPADEQAGVQSFVDARTGMRFLWVPGGRFWMGSGADEEDADEDEKPRHLVEVSGYWLAETPVTNRQYELFLQAQDAGREPRFWRERKYNQPEQPVVGVSWMEARVFCRWLSEKSEHRMELPTEAQWERAARGDGWRKYPWGHKEPDGTRAHYGKNWDGAPIPVGSLPAGRGPYGHLDLAGNVWEWCRDAWDRRAYENREELTVDPEVLGEDDNPGEARVCRGGAFGDEPRDLRSAFRVRFLAEDCYHVLGFRVAAAPVLLTHAPGQSERPAAHAELSPASRKPLDDAAAKPGMKGTAPPSGALEGRAGTHPLRRVAGTPPRLPRTQPVPPTPSIDGGASTIAPTLPTHAPGQSERLAAHAEPSPASREPLDNAAAKSAVKGTAPPSNAIEGRAGAQSPRPEARMPPPPPPPRTQPVPPTPSIDGGASTIAPTLPTHAPGQSEHLAAHAEPSPASREPLDDAAAKPAVKGTAPPSNAIEGRAGAYSSRPEARIPPPPARLPAHAVHTGASTTAPTPPPHVPGQPEYTAAHAEPSPASQRPDDADIKPTSTRHETVPLPDFANGRDRTHPPRPVAARWRFLAVAASMLLMMVVLWLIGSWDVDEDRNIAPLDATPLRPALVRIPSGKFRMGSSEGEWVRFHSDNDERPQHDVEVTGFEMCETEVTQSHWQAVMGHNPSDCASGCGLDLPAQNMSWLEAVMYLNELTRRENQTRPEDQKLSLCYEIEGEDALRKGMHTDVSFLRGAKARVVWKDACTGYRLPTEAEWEYAARANTETAYSFGNEGARLGQYAWHSGMKVQPVKTRKENPWHLYDVHGNVWEWVWDWYGSYPSARQKDPRGPKEGCSRVVRGGSLGRRAQLLRSANRGRNGPGRGRGLIGLRCVRGGAPVLKDDLLPASTEVPEDKSTEVPGATGFNLWVEPSNATVKLDGKFIDLSTPMQIRNLSPGEHELWISAPKGFLSTRRIIRVEACQAPELYIKLEPTK